MKLSDNAEEVATKRYFEKGENWEGLSNRVGTAISLNERHREYWQKAFSEMIYNMEFIPGGRILRNSGKSKQSLLNCGCLPIADNIEEIGETVKNCLILWKYGAGIGIDFTPLREKDRSLVSSGGQASGMLSFLQAIDHIAEVIETGGQRRSGCLGMLRVNHPMIYEFIDAKAVDKTLKYFNLSVAVDKAFLTAVEENANWDLIFAGQKTKTVTARHLWNHILDCTIATGDPGLINYDNLMKNNSYYFQNISCTNLCGEIPLPAYAMCDLGSIVLPAFLSNQSTNWKKLDRVIEAAVRFLDDVLDVNLFPIKQTEIVTKDARRLGLGVMGLHDFLLVKGIKYGSERSLGEVERLFKFIRDSAYKASIKLASEKGGFPKFSRAEFSNASFIKKLPAQIRMDIKEFGIRNCTLISAQPTGTSSLVADVSSGIEPIFSFAYERKDRVSNRMYIHPRLKEFIESKERVRPDWLVDAQSLNPQDHLEVQSVVQKYMDNATSKTINCPKGMTRNKLSKLLLEYIHDLKGVTVYVDGSKGEQPLNVISIKDAARYLKEGKTESNLTIDDVDCARGGCEI